MEQIIYILIGVFSLITIVALDEILTGGSFFLNRLIGKKRIWKPKNTWIFNAGIPKKIRRMELVEITEIDGARAERNIATTNEGERIEIETEKYEIYSLDNTITLYPKKQNDSIEEIMRLKANLQSKHQELNDLTMHYLDYTNKTAEGFGKIRKHIGATMFFPLPQQQGNMGDLIGRNTGEQPAEP